MYNLRSPSSGCVDGRPLHELESTIEHAWATAPTILPSGFECDAIEETLSGLDCGRIRVAERQGVGQWIVNQWVKKACCYLSA
jgi:2,3,4,5-tetrahydropyridine-2-carboxylate N-succinyltransferase